jgi:hypothetical protein
MKGIQQLPPEQDAMAVSNLKAAYVSIHFAIPCLTAFRLDFARIKTDSKNQKMAIKNITSQTGDVIRDLNKLKNIIKPVMDSYKMSNSLDVNADAMIHLIYDLMMLEDKEFDKVIGLINKLKNK